MTHVPKQYPARLVLLTQVSAGSISHFLELENTYRILFNNVKGWKESMQQSIQLLVNPKSENIKADRNFPLYFFHIILFKRISGP